ncbi:MAG: hypothetical protein IJG38_00150 [Thermoguttaceae bacterium]|nr:hypothetical protein [Thermoguttaceae bacterium]
MHTIQKEILEAIFEIATDNGWNLTNTYSGRFMYGAQCFSIDGDGDLGQIAAQLFIEIRENEDIDAYALAEMFGSVRRDNLGLGTVYYFPGWLADEDEFNELCKAYGIDEE